MTDHQNDPLLAEAIARRDESRAQILRSRTNRMGGSAVDRLANAFDKMEEQAEKASRTSRPLWPISSPSSPIRKASATTGWRGRNA